MFYFIRIKCYHFKIQFPIFKFYFKIQFSYKFGSFFFFFCIVLIWVQFVNLDRKLKEEKWMLKCSPKNKQSLFSLCVTVWLLSTFSVPTFPIVKQRSEGARQYKPVFHWETYFWHCSLACMLMLTAQLTNTITIPKPLLTVWLSSSQQ